MREKNALIENLITSGYLKSPEVIRAMQEVERTNFLSKEFISEAYIDRPLPIGEMQTISAPHMVAIMCEEAQLKHGQKVLEIGAGSGYHACIVSKITGSNVFTIERHERLADTARSNLREAGCTKVQVRVSDGTLGYPEESPFERIIVTAAAPDIPKPLVEQLALGGKLLIPVGSRHSQELLRITKIDDDNVEKERLGGCVFVPLIGQYGWKD